VHHDARPINEHSDRSLEVPDEQRRASLDRLQSRPNLILAHNATDIDFRLGFIERLVQRRSFFIVEVIANFATYLMERNQLHHLALRQVSRLVELESAVFNAGFQRGHKAPGYTFRVRYPKGSCRRRRSRTSRIVGEGFEGFVEVLGYFHQIARTSKRATSFGG